MSTSARPASSLATPFIVEEEDAEGPVTSLRAPFDGGWVTHRALRMREQGRGMWIGAGGER